MTPLNLNPSLYQENLLKELKLALGEKTNIFEYPSISHLSLNIGVGKFENKQKDEIANQFEKLTGQKPKKVKTNKSVAGFKLRAGEVVGLQVTLRGKKVYDFLINLVYTALPRGRDFKGVSKTAWDKSNKTFSIGIPTTSIFPVIGFGNNIESGLQINIVFKNNHELNYKVLEILNIPFSK
jgi:large subunit ribosomal protein L5